MGLIRKFGQEIIQGEPRALVMPTKEETFK